MKELCVGGFNMAVLVGGASCLMLAAGPAFAQRGAPGATAVERRMETLNRQGVQYERDRLSRDGKGAPEAPDKRRRAQDVAGQVRRDFEGLQAGYNKIVLATASGERPDSDTILDSVAEVRKCAARLKHNLALPRAQEDGGDGGNEKENHAAERRAAVSAGAAGTEEPLRLLRKHIYSFVTNPLFEAPSVLDVEKAEKAGRDLDIIIELSEAIGKSGGRSEKREN
jgi:hypothetical protein